MAQGACSVPTKDLGQLKGLSLRVSDSSQQQLCRKDAGTSQAEVIHFLELSASLSVPQTLKSTQLLPQGSNRLINS